jgi:hypothetical protein
VYHYCHFDGRQDSFLCSNGTVFNQKEPDHTTLSNKNKLFLCCREIIVVFSTFCTATVWMRSSLLKVSRGFIKKGIALIAKTLCAEVLRFVLQKLSCGKSNSWGERLDDRFQCPMT